MNHRRLFHGGAFGSIVLALCCVTPTLFLLLSAWAGGLVVVSIPTLVLCLLLTLWAWRRSRRGAACAVEPKPTARLKADT